MWHTPVLDGLFKRGWLHLLPHDSFVGVSSNQANRHCDLIWSRLTYFLSGVVFCLDFDPFSLSFFLLLFTCWIFSFIYLFILGTCSLLWASTFTLRFCRCFACSLTYSKVMGFFFFFFFSTLCFEIFLLIRL
jgi:hypothetical protein